MKAAEWEPGPYRQLIAINNGSSFSTLKAIHNAESQEVLKPAIGNFNIIF